jgi:hypothetical protein
MAALVLHLVVLFGRLGSVSALHYILHCWESFSFPCLCQTPIGLYAHQFAACLSPLLCGWGATLIDA